MKKSLILLIGILMTIVSLADQPENPGNENQGSDTKGDISLTIKVPSGVEEEDILISVHRGNGNVEVDLVKQNTVGGLTSYTGVVENTGNVGGVKLSLVYKYINPDGEVEYVTLIGDVKDNKIDQAQNSFENMIEDGKNLTPADPDIVFDVDSGNFVNSDNLFIPSSNNISFTAGVSYDETATEAPWGNVYYQEVHTMDGKDYIYNLIKPGEVTNYYTSDLKIKNRVEGSQRERRANIELSNSETPGNFEVKSSEEGAK